MGNYELELQGKREALKEFTDKKNLEHRHPEIDICDREVLKVYDYVIERLSREIKEFELTEKAKNVVYISMNLGDIEEECKRLKIRIVKNRSIMEQKLIKAYVKEWIDNS